ERKCETNDTRSESEALGRNLRSVMETTTVREASLLPHWCFTIPPRSSSLAISAWTTCGLDEVRSRATAARLAGPIALAPNANAPRGHETRASCSKAGADPATRAALAEQTHATSATFTARSYRREGSAKVH